PSHTGGLCGDGLPSPAGHRHTPGFPVCIELKPGKVVWRKDRGPGTGSAAIVYADGRLYFRYESAVVALIEATTEGYRLKGKFPIPGGKTPRWQHPVIVGGQLYLRDQDQLFLYELRPRRR